VLGIISRKLDDLKKGQTEIMASIADILAAQAQEDADLKTLTTSVQTLLAAFANGQITPAQAQQILTDMQAEDATVNTLNSSINTALGTAPVAATTSAVKPA
jgi:ABC-type transporter Mla subunit MlaD